MLSFEDLTREQYQWLQRVNKRHYKLGRGETIEQPVSQPSEDQEPQVSSWDIGSEELSVEEAIKAIQEIGFM